MEYEYEIRVNKVIDEGYGTDSTAEAHANDIAAELAHERGDNEKRPVVFVVNMDNNKVVYRVRVPELEPWGEVWDY